MSKYDVLFTPVKIGNLKIKNRFIMMPMGGTPVYNRRGTYADEVCDYLIERAKGGVGMIVTGCNFVRMIEGNAVTKALIAHNKYRFGWMYEYKDAFMLTRQLTDEVHKYGCKILLQVGTGYGRALRGDRKTLSELLPPDVVDKYFIAADTTPNVFYPDPENNHRGLTKEEIEEYVYAHVEVAKMAKAAGFDGVEIHAVHEGYVLDQFSTEYTNHRTDEYGGSLENRLRFATDVIRRTKEACGDDFCVGMRYSVASKAKAFNVGALPGEAYKEVGRSLEESPAVARLLEEAGVDFLDCDNGTYDSWFWCHPPMYMPEGCNLPDAAFIKNYVNIPVITSGRMDNPDLAAAAISDHKVDAIGLGRALLADSEYVNKLAAGDLDDIRPCLSCHNGCLAQLNLGHHLSCVVNPAVLREKTTVLKPAEVRKKVAVIGGGIGGMEAARLCAEKGHDVTLYEKSGELGGVFIAAAAMDFKEADKRLITWYIRKVNQSGVKVLLNTEASPEILKEEGYDAVIVATGALPKTLPLKGFDNTIEAIDALLGKRPELGDRVAIIGGGVTGTELAYELVLHGAHPFIIEAQSQICTVADICDANRFMLRTLMEYHKVPVYTSASVKEIGKDSVTFTDAEGVERTIETDSVVSAVGYKPDVKTSSAFDGSAAEVYVIGTAKEWGNLLPVVRDAYAAAFAI